MVHLVRDEDEFMIHLFGIENIRLTRLFSIFLNVGSSCLECVVTRKIKANGLFVKLEVSSSLH